MELNDTFVMNKEDLIATLTDPKFTNPKAQVFYRTPDGELHPAMMLALFYALPVPGRYYPERSDPGPGQPIHE